MDAVNIIEVNYIASCAYQASSVAGLCGVPAKGNRCLSWGQPWEPEQWEGEGWTTVRDNCSGWTHCRAGIVVLRPRPARGSGCSEITSPTCSSVVGLGCRLSLQAALPMLWQDTLLQADPKLCDSCIIPLVWKPHDSGICDCQGWKGALTAHDAGTEDPGPVHLLLIFRFPSRWGQVVVVVVVTAVSDGSRWLMLSLSGRTAQMCPGAGGWRGVRALDTSPSLPFCHCQKYLKYSPL